MRVVQNVTRGANKAAHEGGVPPVDCGLFAPDVFAQKRFDEQANFAIQNRLRVAGFGVGAMVFDHIIRMKNIRTDLITPGCFAIFAPQLEAFFALLLELAFKQA